MSHLDAAILSTFPLIAVPPSGVVPPATANGTRYLAARDGLWREINLPWLTLRHHVSTSAIRLPYGEVEPVVDFKCGPVPVELVRLFNDDARAQAPRECAGAVLWNEATGEWRFEPRHARSASAAHILYDEVQPHDGEHLVVDVHSHGHFDAFFSQEDNKDDYGSIKVSLVVGSFNNPQPTSAMRLCAAGFQFPARITGQGLMEVCP